jgi:ureidoacrylate peracid hydrolase
MNVRGDRVISTKTAMAEPVIVEAEPEPLEIDLRRLVVIIIDMQNAFVSKGGMFDLWSYDISNSLRIIKPIKKIIAAARERRVKVIYVAHRLSPDLRDIYPSSPFYHKNVLVSYREQPQIRDKLIIRGTWGAEIVNELKPQEDDIVVEKQRYSAFVGTNLDMILNTYDTKYIAFTGVATNICVESSLRDSSHLEYFPILISDAAASVSEPVQVMSINNVKECFGWVTTTDNFTQALK